MNESDLGPRVPINAHHPVGYAHARPVRRPVTIDTIAARWSYWSDRAVLASKRASNPADEFSRLRFLHNVRLERLLAAGLAWKPITRGDLDSPFLHPAEFDRALCLALRASYIGRRAGRTKRAKRERGSK